MTAPSLKLAYIVIESMRMDDWRRFAGEGLGLHVESGERGELVLRMDDYARRFVIVPGKAEDVVALGWETGALGQMESHLRSEGVDLTEGNVSEAELRGVERFFGYAGPKGLKMEFCTAPKRTNKPLNMLASGFWTGEGGLGHAVMTTRHPEKLRQSFERLLGAKLSDTITDKIQGIEMELSFFHLNERHHSLAMASTRGVRIDPLRTRIQHFMIEANQLDDVSDAYRRCKSLGYRIAMGMGQHPNDKGISFYVVSPSDIEFEMGCDTVRVPQDGSWIPDAYEGMSKWGHKPEFKPSLAEKLVTAWRAARSLFRNEPD